VGLMEDRSSTVTTGLSSVIDLKRLGAVAAWIPAAAPKRTEPTGSLHRVGAAHPFARHLLRYGLAGASRINLIDGGLRWL
jgi:hypothetical protein